MKKVIAEEEEVREGSEEQVEEALNPITDDLPEI